MMAPETDCVGCYTQGCSTVVNLHDYPEALCDGCGEVNCGNHGHDCGSDAA